MFYVINGYDYFSIRYYYELKNYGKERGFVRVKSGYWVFLGGFYLYFWDKFFRFSFLLSLFIDRFFGSFFV